MLGGGGGSGVGTIYVPISTDGSGTPTTRPRTDYPVQGLGARGKVGCCCNFEIQLRIMNGT